MNMKLKFAILALAASALVVSAQTTPSFRQAVTSTTPLTLASNATTTVYATNLVAASAANPVPGTIDLTPGQPLYVAANLKGSAANGTTSNIISAFQLSCPNFGAAPGKYTTGYVYATNYANGTSEVVAITSIPAASLAGATKAKLVSIQNTSTNNIVTVSNLTFGVFK